VLQVIVSWQAFSDYRLNTITLFCRHAVFRMCWSQFLLFQGVIQMKLNAMANIFVEEEYGVRVCRLYGWLGYQFVFLG